MVRLVLLLLFIGACSPVLALDCPAGTVRVLDDCIRPPTQEHGFLGQPNLPLSPSHPYNGQDSSLRQMGEPVQAVLPPPPPLPPLYGGQSSGIPPNSLFHGFSGARPLGASKTIGVMRLFPVRAYLAFDEIPPPGIGAYGIVVVRARPTNVDRARLHMMCSAFKATLAKQRELPASITAEEQMLTIWPLDKPQDRHAQDDECDYVLDTYALAAGDQAISDATRQGYSFSGQGPYLVGWSPSNTRGVKDKLALVIDMSGFDSQDSFNKSFLFWKQKVVEDPALWRNGFSAERFRLSVHDFADHYGKAFVEAIKLFSSK